MNRLEYIDIVKGLAIILVVAGHILQFNFSCDPCEEVFNWIYSFHMPLFMCLSGYVAAFNLGKVQDNSSLSFIFKKTQTLLLPYFTWSFVLWPLIIYKLSIDDLQGYYVNLLCNPSNGYWFICQLYFCQLFFLIFAKMVKKIKHLKFCQALRNGNKDYLSRFLIYGFPSFVVFSLAIVGSLSINNMFTYIKVQGSNYYFSVFYIFWFFFGSVLYYMSSWLQKRIVLFFFTLLFLYLSPSYVRQESSIILFCIISFCACISFIGLSRNIREIGNNPISKYLAYLGHYTLDIYLVHILFVKIFKNTIQFVDFRPMPLFIGIVGVSFVACIICVFISKVIRLMPYGGFLFFGSKKKNVPNIPLAH